MNIKPALASRRRFFPDSLLRFAFFGFIFQFHFFAFASEQSVQKPDSNLVKQLLDSGFVLESIDYKAALKIYSEANKVSKEINYVLGQAKALHYRGIVYSDKSEYREALQNYRQAKKLYEQINYKRGVGACHTNMGNLYRYQSKYDSALVYYQAGIRLFKQSSQLDGLSMAYGNAGGIFQSMKQLEKALSYFILSEKAAAQANDSLSLCRALINQGTILNDLKQYKNSYRVNRKALEIATRQEDDYGLQLATINLADHYKRLHQYENAIQFGLKSLHYTLKLANPYDIADIKRRLGDLYLLSGKPDKSNAFYLEAIAISEKIKATEISENIYTSLHKLHAGTGEFKLAYKYQALAQQYQDSILGEKELKAINELELKYQTLEKDKELAQQQLQLEKSRQYIIYSFGAALIAFLLVALLVVYYNYKRKSHYRQLKTVQQENEIQVLQAWVKGEEKERTRIAHNLHDEIAGILAAAKMHMNALEIQAQEINSHSGYHKVLDLLNQASVSVRKTAHNLMPEVLMHHGLDKALRRFCTNISNEELLVVNYDSLGRIRRFPADFELSIYRIVQELMNNTLKHSKATAVLIQLSFHIEVLSITIEDNGIGFKKTNFPLEGMGLNSLFSRVNALKGKIDINSEEGQGVSVYLEFETTEYPEPVMLEEAAG